MDPRTKISLSREEYSAIIKLAVDDLRSLDDEIRYLLRCELERRGLINQEEAQPEREVTHESAR